jgi:hypothetical protein
MVDPDYTNYGDTVQGLQLWATGTSGGYFTINGARQATNTTITVASADVANVKYVAGTAGAAEVTYAKAYDGTLWSDWYMWNQVSGGVSSVVNQTLPQPASYPFSIQSQANVATWKVTTTITLADSAVKTATYTVKQDGAGGNIGFMPSLHTAGNGASIQITAQGLNANGAVIVSSAQLGMTGSFGLGSTPFNGSTLTVKLISLSPAGVLTGLPVSYTASDNTVLLLSSTSGFTGQNTYSTEVLAQALNSNSVLAQYAAAGRLGLSGLTNTVDPLGNNPNEGSVTVAGYTLPIVVGGSDLAAYENGGMMAIRSTASSATVKVWVSVNGAAATQVDTISLTSGQTEELVSRNWGLTRSTTSLNTVKVYFTDANGNAVTGLQAATLPVPGGLLPESSWQSISAYASLNSALSVYSGTVAQIMSVVNTAPRGSLYYLRDTIENIQSSTGLINLQLYALASSGQLIGAQATNGFDGIRHITQIATPFAIKDGSGNTVYVRSEPQGTWDGPQAHSVLAVKSATTANIGVYIDGVLATTLNSVSTATGLLLPKEAIANLSNGLHTITLSGGAQIGVVPPGGGLPASYSSTQSIWIGTASQLPTSLSNIQANTLYIINDYAANIVALDSYNALQTDVINQLANSGYLAYRSMNGLSWSQLYQLQQAGDLPIANIGPVTITDSAYVIENHLWDLGLGQYPAIRDTMARLLSPKFAEAAKALSAGTATNVNDIIWNSALQQVFNNHQITWSDSLTSLSNSSHLTSMASVYYGTNGQLAAVQAYDTIANYQQVSSASQVSAITNFVSTNAGGNLTVSIRDSIANLTAAFVSGDLLAWENQVKNSFSGAARLSARVEILDSVTNLTSAKDSGALDALLAAANGFTTAVANSNNYGATLRVQDSIANIDELLASGTYSALSAQVSSYSVVDTVANITAQLPNTWGKALASANNIVVQDTYLNIKASSNLLFDSADYGGQITKVVFTDLSGIDANSPLIIGIQYSDSGQMPQFDFKDAVGLQGQIKVTETVLTRAEVSSIVAANSGLNSASAKSGIALTITDSNGHAVVINVLSSQYSGTGTYNPDPNFNYRSAVYLPSMPYSVTDPYPLVEPDPMVLIGDASVTTWKIVQMHYAANGSTVKDSNLYSVKQGSSGGDIAFAPQWANMDNVQVGDRFSFSAQGLDASGNIVVASGALEFNWPSHSAGRGTALNMYIVGIGDDGVVTGLPGSYDAKNGMVLVSSTGFGNNNAFSVNALKNALTSNTLLKQYATNGQVYVAALEGGTDASGINRGNPSISIDGLELPMVGGIHGPWNPMAIKAAVDAAAFEWVSYDNGLTYQKKGVASLTAGDSENLDHWDWNLANIPTTSARVTKVYFGDSNGAALTGKGLQIATMPVTGGVIAPSAWVNAPTSAATAMTIYNGTVAQLIALAPVANSYFYINDTIANIRAAGTSLIGGKSVFDLVNAGNVIGVSPTDGFDGIAGMSTKQLALLSIAGPNNQTAYVHITQGGTWDGSQAHSVFSVVTSAATSVQVKIDGTTVKTITTTAGTATGLVLPAATLAALADGTHTITLTPTSGTATVAVVPAGGGYPTAASYSTSQSIWVGKAADLPTSLADIAAKTVYVVRDTAQNILALNGYSSFQTGVLETLGSTGYLAYSSTTGMSWAQIHQLQQSNNNVPIANISDVIIRDSAYAIENHFWSVGAGQSFAISDTMARLLSPKFVEAAQAMSAGTATKVDNMIWSNPLRSAFNDHEIRWNDGLTSLNNASHLNSMAAVYYGTNGQLDAVMASDTVANFKLVTSAASISALTGFVNTNASGMIIVNLRDTVENIYAALTDAGASAFKAQLAGNFAAARQVYSRLQVEDSVANLQAAYGNGKIATLDAAADTIFASNNFGLDLRVIDTVANINAVIVDGDYSKLASYIASYVVHDTAVNIVNAIQKNNWDSAVSTANNIVVEDTYLNIKANAAVLFDSNGINSDGLRVTKVIFTDITGADANSPLIIGSQYSDYGQMPQFDFRDTVGLQGHIIKSESVLSQATVASLVSTNAANAGSNARSGVALSITDSNGHAVVINVLSSQYSGTGTYNPDPNFNYRSAVYLPNLPYSVTDPYPAIAPEPFVLLGNASVSSWEITQKHYAANGVTVKDTDTFAVKQGSSGNAISFAPQWGSGASGISIGDYYTYSAQGLNSAGGVVVSNGNLSFNNPDQMAISNTIKLYVVGIDSTGATVTGLPSTYTADAGILIMSSAGVSGNRSYSVEALKNALANNALLKQYATSGQALVGALAGSVDSAGLNGSNPIISIDGIEIAMAGGLLGAWNPMAIKASADTTVYQYVSYDNGASYKQMNSAALTAGNADNLDHWDWNLANIPTTSARVTKVYFGDSNGAALTGKGLQIATMPVTGGVIAPSAWVNAASSAASAMTIYNGTVAQLVALSPVANSYFYINDTIANIRAAGTSLIGGKSVFDLVNAGNVIGVSPTDGFDGIAGMGTEGLALLSIAGPNNQTAYVHITQGGTWDGSQAHSVFSVVTSAATSVQVKIDGTTVKTITTTAGTATGLVLPAATLAALADGTHTITLTPTSGTATVAVVPAGGGYPTAASYSTSQSIWVGKAADLPTSLADIAAKTVYVVRDTAQNILALNGYSSFQTGVLETLGSTGYLAYSSTTGMSWAQIHQLQQSNNNVPIANISDVIIRDSAYAIENHFWSVGAGQSFAISDTMARLLSPKFVEAAQAMSAGTATKVDNMIWSNPLRSAFNDHEIRWNDGLTSLNNASHLNSMAAVYYGTNGQLDAVMASDTVANFKLVTSAASISALTGFVNTNASGMIIVNLRDTVENIYAALTDAGASAFKAQLAGNFAAARQVYSRLQVEDSVANLQAAYGNGKIATLDAAADTIFASNNFGLDLRVIDTVANINAVIVDGDYSKLASYIASYVVHDTAVNIVNAIQKNNWDSAVSTANNIVVEDTYLNIKANAAVLFDSNGINSDGLRVTKVIFTDITGADANSPLIIGSQYSDYGQMPQFDFRDTVGLQGHIIKSESVLSQATVASLVSTNAANAGSNARSGVALSITDSNGHAVVINVLSSQYSGTGTYNPDPNFNYRSAVYLPNLPYSVTDPYPAIAPEPFVLLGNASVSSWEITQKHYAANGVTVKDTDTFAVKQGSSGNAISFAPQWGSGASGISIGDYYTYSAQGLNSAGGVVVSNGNLSFNNPDQMAISNTIKLYVVGIDSTGATVTGLPSTYTADAGILIMSSAGVSGNRSYSVEALKNALANNALLKQYATSGQALVGALAGSVDSAGLNGSNPIISIDGIEIAMAGGLLGAWNPMAIKASADTTVYQYVSYDNGASYKQMNSAALTAGNADNLDHWDWNLANIPTTSARVTKVYFGDSNGAALTGKGLQIATMPVTGGVIAPSAWVNAASSAASAMTIYNGTVAQLVALSPVANSYFYINDTIANIRAAGTSLIGGKSVFDLVNAGNVIGVSPTDGFDGIAGMGTEGLALLSIAGPNNQTAYVHITQGGTWDGSQAHSVFSVVTSAATSVQVKIDGTTVKTITTTAGTATGLVLPAATLAALADGTHTITLTPTSGTATVAVVPAGGGYPTAASYSTSQSIWVGKAADLPTSLADIAAKTVYVVRDTAQNILALNGYSSFQTGVLETLGSTGYLAYSSTTGMSWAQIHQLQQSNNNVPIANISDVIIRDSAYAIENHFWSVGAGQSFAIQDNMARLLSPTFAQVAQKINTGQISSASQGTSSANLASAFDNHQISWSDSLFTLRNSSNLSAMSSVYSGVNQLASVQVRDTIANLSSGISASAQTSLINFINTSASQTAIIAIQDTVANLSALIASASTVNSLKAQLASAYGVSNLSSRLEIQDTVENLRALYINGKPTATMLAIQNEADIFFASARPSAINLGLNVRVTDSVSNINNLINNGSDVNLASKVSSYIVVDTAANIVASINKNHWESATNIANNIVVKDTYLNIKNNAGTLFNASQSNGDHVAVTKVIFTDLVGADSSAPLIVGTGYTANGQLPQFDFSQASGITGQLSVTESVLSKSVVTTLASDTSTAGIGAKSGVSLKIGDSSSSSKVVINILTKVDTTANPDSTNSAILSVIASSSMTPTKIYQIDAGENGAPSASVYETILGISTGDKISYTKGLTTASTTASPGQAGINGSTGVASFNSSDSTNTLKIEAVEKALNITPIDGRVALYSDTSSSVQKTNVFIADAVVASSTTAASAGDNLIQVVGVAPSQVSLSGGVLTVVP